MTDTNPLDQPAVFTERMRRQIARGAEYSDWIMKRAHQSRLVTVSECNTKWSRLTALHGLDEPAAPAFKERVWTEPVGRGDHKVILWKLLPGGKIECHGYGGTFSSYDYPTVASAEQAVREGKLIELDPATLDVLGSTPAAPDPQRVRVFVGKSDDDHRRGTHGAWRLPTGRFWLRGKDYDVSEFTLAECEKNTDLRELRPDEFDLMPGEPGYVEPVKQAEPKLDDELARLRAEVDRLTMALSRSEKEAALLREHIQKRKPRAKKRKAVRRG